ncbi:MAG: branched-chain amino acid ABC transporter permease [Thermobacillus sp. ZCTH02-B1]|uniref:AzlC family ABC transporter permease n=1 Tax=Thermobacillus sp. ZCTH02-B1 TaxID=1858795 RepID=UPI000B561D49|nr:AzlC family ABC transporter permease [Thermobacillus sp. ZCTH02-B1]OUM94046.1 MAG: branched-chain amino acid ABC transporter permease [Thermobacillus sp. ZCTH02-B1]
MGNRTAETLTFRQGVVDCVPTLLGYLTIGFAAGVIEATAGMSLLEIGLLSLFLYAGSAQFITAGMMMAGAPVLSVVGTVFIVNLRHLLMSAALAPKFKGYSPLKNFLIGAQLTDETFGVAAGRLTGGERGADRWMFGLNVTAQANWIVANLLGALLGGWIADPERFGLHYALPAMFIGLAAIIVMQNRQYGRDLLVIGCAAGGFALAFLWLPGHLAVMAAAVLAAIAGAVTER